MTHGGDIARVASRYGIPAAQLVDFSANLNPRGLPAGAVERLARDARDARVVASYPDADASELTDALRKRLEVPAECIVIGSGADALIHAAVRAFAPRRCVVPVPAFGEYERACRAFGCEFRQIMLHPGAGFALQSEALRDIAPGDLIILNNPHNPTGRTTICAEMRKQCRQVRSRGARVLVDEAFVDYAPGNAVTGDAAVDPGTIAVRSLTKFFGCAGLRVGYAVATPESAERLALQLPPWPVSMLALNALAEAVRDTEYERATLDDNERERAALGPALVELGCMVFPSGANFLLIRLPDGPGAGMVRERLIREHRIIVRACDSFAGLEGDCYIRVAVRTANENARLVHGLRQTMGEIQCSRKS
jgi:threonine-phosphate decarboxylase